jgi:hypothetical protein
MSEQRWLFACQLRRRFGANSAKLLGMRFSFHPHMYYVHTSHHLSNSIFSSFAANAFISLFQHTNKAYQVNYAQKRWHVYIKNFIPWRDLNPSRLFLRRMQCPLRYANSTEVQYIHTYIRNVHTKKNAKKTPRGPVRKVLSNQSPGIAANKAN